MERLTIAEYAKTVLDAYRQKVPEDGTPTQFHARTALANCEVPISPKDSVYDNLKGNATVVFNPDTLEAAVKYLVRKKIERIEALGRIRNGTPNQKHDGIDLTEIRTKAGFPTNQDTWTALRQGEFPVADLEVWFEALRFWYAKTPVLETWIEAMARINSERRSLERRKEETATVS